MCMNNYILNFQDIAMVQKFTLNNIFKILLDISSSKLILLL